MDTKFYIGAFASITILAGSVFAQGLDIAKIKSDAESGNTMAQTQYAQMLQTGNGVEKNEAEALKWYQKAAEAGNAYAQANMGVLCQTGGCGVMKDIVKAAEWYEKASKQENAYAQYYLALLYEGGDGVEKNMTKAVELYGKAANGGVPDAMIKYAIELSTGENVDSNVDEALKWAEKAAATGHDMAVRLVSSLKDMKVLFDKTPKSFLGVEFGKKIEEIGCQGNALKTSDGMAVHNYLRNGKKFRKFTDYNRMEVFGSITAHEVFKFNWHSEEFPAGTARQDACDEIVETCEVICKKFGGEYSENEGIYTVVFGWMTITMKYESMGRYIDMWVMNTLYENKAKKEVELLKSSEGDGSDAL